MRILQIDLRAYAHYSNDSINFDAKKNIHVIFGENEAGKSSFTRALQALLFGLEKKTADTFVHPFENLYLEGLLQNDAGKFLKITRNSENRKKQILSQLGLSTSFDKQTILNLFFLNQESIVLGSKDLVENIKHFDVSLFTSIQGIQSILKTLKNAEAEIENLYKPKGVKPIINQKLKLIKDLQLQKTDLNLSLGKWEELQTEVEKIEQSKDIYLKSLSVAAEELAQLKVLEETFFVIKEFMKLSETVQNINTDTILNKEFIDKYLILENQVKNHTRQKNQLHSDIQKIKEDLNLLSYDQELINKKTELELLSKEYSDYALILKRESDLQNELAKTKLAFKNINLDLQSVIKASFSLCNWEKVRTNILEILESLRLTSKLHSKNLNIKDQLELELQKLVQKKSLLKFFDLEEDYKLLWKLESKADQSRSLKEIQEELDPLLCKINAFPFLKLEVTRQSTFVFNEADKNSIIQLHKQYFDLITHYRLNNDQLQRCKSALLKFKEDDLLSRSSCESKLENYFKNKKLRHSLSESLLETWTSQNMDEKYLSYLELKSLLDKEDIVEEYLFDNIKYFANANEMRDLDKKIESLTILDANYLTKIKEFKEKVYSNVDCFKYIDRVNFLDSELVDNIFSFFENILPLITLINEEKSQLDLNLEIDNYLGSSNHTLNISQSIVKIKESIESKKQSNTVIETVEASISSLEKSVEMISKEIQKNVVSLSKLKSNWTNVCSQFQIECSFDLSDIESLISKMDNFFKFSKIIKSENLILKELIDKIKVYNEKFHKIVGFTDINPKFILVKLDEALEHEKIKINHANLSFLKESKSRQLTEVTKEQDVQAKKLSKLFIDFSVEESDFTSNCLNESKTYFSLQQQLSQLKSKLELKCSGFGLDYYIELLSLHSDLASIKSLIEKKSIEVSDLHSKLTVCDNELGALTYKENLTYDFDIKYELEKKIQSEVFELKELLNTLLIAKTTVKFVKNTIWDFQKEFQRKILNNASLYFKELTDGKYVELQLNFLDGKESFLECVSMDKQVLNVSQLSEGTRDQLYISLKFAFIEIYFSNNEPFPLILDDILVNFDDRRTRRCLQIIKKISMKTQVILLTHHQHLVDLINNDLNDDSFEIIQLQQQRNLVAS